MHTMRTTFTILLTLSGLKSVCAVDDTATPAPVAATKHEPKLILSDGKLRLTFGEERVILPRGLQPSLLRTHSGALLLQAQLPQKPFPAKRIAYPYAMSTRVSRDGGLTWTTIPLKPGDNGLNMEGGAVQLRDGTIVALDTYVVPGEVPGMGVGQLYLSTDDWKTVRGPRDVLFDMPRAKFTGSSDDGGRPHAAQRAPPPYSRTAQWRSAHESLRLAGWRRHSRDLREDDDEVPLPLGAVKRSRRTLETGLDHRS